MHQSDIEIGGTGPAIVFLHGAGVDKALWKPQMQALSDQFRCIALDLPGHGDVSAVADVPAMAEHVHARLLHLRVEHYAVVGLSLGGMVALQMAASWPDEVTHLVMVESVPHVANSSIAFLLGRCAVGLFKVISPRLLAAVPARQMGAVGEDTGHYLKSAIRRMTRQKNHAVMKAALIYDGRSHVTSLQMPTLIMVGARNRYTHKGAQEMAARIKGARFIVIPGAGHIANRDATDFVNDTVRAFVAGASDSTEDATT
jgi:pimeloyl-[acyl-carrier protein] methyl ester esterase